MEGREEDRGTNTLATWRPEGDGWLVDDGEEGSLVLGYVECEGKTLAMKVLILLSWINLQNISTASW